MTTRRTRQTLRSPVSPVSPVARKDPSESESDEDQESETTESENTSFHSHASGSVSYCAESPGSASFEVRNRSNFSSPGSESESFIGESPKGTPRSEGRSPRSEGRPFTRSPLAYQNRGKLYPSLESVSPGLTRSAPSPGSTRSPRSTSPRLRSPKSRKQEQECQEVHLPDLNVIIGFLLVVALLIGGCMLYYYSSEKSTRQVGMQTPNPRQVVRDAFNLGSRKLTAAFPSQTSNFWATINAAVKSIMDPNIEPLQPAVIMITCTRDTCPLANCIATTLAKSVTEAYASQAPLDLNVTSDLLPLRAEDSKLKIDDDIRSSLRSGSQAVIMRNLHDLQGGAAMILHGFCDNENAPFKEAVLIYTLEFPGKPAINTAIGLNNAIESTLYKAWGKDLDTDNLSALYSRLVNSPVYVKAESAETFQKQCS